ncbi:2-hydroxyacid dehydrogenase [Pacificoceanicola onchidii]|uniref:2-hydroxyacid dehydrogenase n=1 Tax=Pacificoceanicola onchidii TaxID=2562685 RepID=UPI0010A59E4D|nr:2-hydroxyacid dehydrogenase [Pacificoceanicola onchidii]
MTRTPLLIMGGGTTAEDRARLEAAHPSVFASNFDELAALDAETRAGIRAVAYRGHYRFDGTGMDLLPNLEVIANFGVGYDQIIVSDATARGVKVTNTPDVLNDDVADLAVAMLLAQCRNMVAGDARVRNGEWPAKGELPLNRKVTGSTAGIVGLGRIGREIADRLAAFKMEIHYTSRTEKETPGWTYHGSDVVSLARAVDFLVVAIVGGPETEKTVSRAAIEALGPRGVIVNISRGTTIDEAAMLDALEAGAIAGAGLDVFEGEPEVNPRFFALDNVHLQPHQGSGTVETRRAMAMLQLANVTACLEGQPLKTPVN